MAIFIAPTSFLARHSEISREDKINQVFLDTNNQGDLNIETPRKTLCRDNENKPAYMGWVECIIKVNREFYAKFHLTDQHLVWTKEEYGAVRGEVIINWTLSSEIDITEPPPPGVIILMGVGDIIRPPPFPPRKAVGGMAGTIEFISKAGERNGSIRCPVLFSGYGKTQLILGVVCEVAPIYCGTFSWLYSYTHWVWDQAILTVSLEEP